MQIPRPRSRPLSQKPWGWRPAMCTLLARPVGDCSWLMLRFENHWSSSNPSLLHRWGNREPEESSDLLELTLVSITTRSRTWAPRCPVRCICILNWTSFHSLQLQPEKPKLGPIVIAFCLCPPILHQGKVCFPEAPGFFRFFLDGCWSLLFGSCINNEQARPALFSHS